MMRHLLASVLAALLLAAATTAARAQSATENTFKDWKVRCEQVQADQPVQCRMIHLVRLKDTNQRVLLAMIGFLPDQPDPIAVFEVQLNTLLAAGVSLQIDEGEPATVGYEFCHPQGCRASMKLTPELIASMQRGQKFTVSYVDLLKRRINIPASLSGFTAALNALQQR